MAGDPALGMRIRRARERLRWSQEDLATRARVSVRSIGDWENGRRYPRSAIGSLEHVLGVSLTGDQEAEPHFSDPAEQAIWDTMTRYTEAERHAAIREYRLRRASGDQAAG